MFLYVPKRRRSRGDLKRDGAIPQQAIRHVTLKDEDVDGNYGDLSNSEGGEKRCAVFWNATPCSLVNMCQTFGEMLNLS
jgi:hypothetical protein